MTLPKIPLNGTEIYYQQEGSGSRTFLLFNGAGCETGTWGETATQLAEMGQVIRFDHRDVGETTEATEPYTLGTLAADALALLDHLGIERAVIIGHAFGGRVAQVFTRDNPECVSALILCGTGGQFPPNLPEIDENVRGKDRFLAVYCGSEFSTRHPARAQRLFDDIRSQKIHPGANKRRGQAIQATPSDTYWGKIPSSIPVLLLYGTEDRFGTPENARDLKKRLEGSRLLFFDGVGHFAMREEPERVLEEIKQFVVDKAL